MELWWVLMLHALCVVLTIGVIWMSYAFSAIENTQERRSEVNSILVGVFTTFIFLGCGTALVWLCEEDRKEMVSALAMMLAMIMLMHVMVAFTQRVIGTAASRLSLGTLLSGFTLVVYCILSLVIFANSDLAMFGVARELKRSVTGHLPIDEWLYVKKPAVLRVLSDALGEHDHAYQYVARRLDELSGRPEIKDVLLIAKDGVLMIEDQDLRVKIMADIIRILADAVVSDVAVLPALADPNAKAVKGVTFAPVLPARADKDGAKVATVEPVLPAKAAKGVTFAPVLPAGADKDGAKVATVEPVLPAKAGKDGVPPLSHSVASSRRPSSSGEMADGERASGKSSISSSSSSKSPKTEPVGAAFGSIIPVHSAAVSESGSGSFVSGTGSSRSSVPRPLKW